MIMLFKVIPLPIFPHLQFTGKGSESSSACNNFYYVFLLSFHVVFSPPLPLWLVTFFVSGYSLFQCT